MNATRSPIRSRRTWVLVLIVAGLALGGLIFAFVTSRSAAPDVGQPAPAFRLITRDGLQIDSRTLRGSILIVNFFASWCKPCDTEAPQLEAIWRDYRDRGVIVVGITYKDTDAKVNEFVSRHGITFPVANDVTDVARKFGITGVPETYVIDQDGVFVYKRIGEIEPAELRRILDEHLR